MDGSDLAAKVQQAIARRSGSSPSDKWGYRWPAGSLCSCHCPKIVNPMPVFNGGFRG